MSRAIGSGILLNILLAGGRGRFFRTTFGTSTHRLWLLVISCISGTILALFPVFHDFGRGEAFAYTTSTSFALPTMLILLVALLLVASSTYVLLGILPSFFSRKQLITMLCILICILSVRVFGITSGIILWLLIAAIEERVKTSTNLALYDRFSYLHSDIIFFGLLSALGFSVVENMVYLFMSDVSSFESAFGIIFKRTLTSRVMHLCYTGIIALGISWSLQTSKQWSKTIGLILIAIGTHTLFNTALHTTNMGIVLLIILGGYLFITWLIYKSERVYI